MKKILISLMMVFVMSFNSHAEEDVDPFENVNRGIYEFNEALDDNLFEPVARGYKENIPEFMQDRIRDFFSNIGDISTLANQILQFKFENSVVTLGRITVNTTVGLAGLFDVATDMDLKKTKEDFGQTLGTWGVSDGPFIMLPILGPSTLRDTAGLYVDISSDANVINQLDGSDKNAAVLTGALDKRVELLPITDLLEDSDDPYIAMRSSYLQKRKDDIYDGNVPITDEDF